MPPLYVAADDSAISGQTLLLWLTRVRLFALIMVAAAGVFSTVIAERASLLIVAAAFVIAVLLEAALWVTKPARKWYDGRAAAESLKTLVWRYSVKGKPFDDALTDEEADDLFLTRVADVLQGLRGFPRDTAGHQEAAQITPQMRVLRQMDLRERVDAYDRERIRDQQTWYSRSSQRNSRRARIWTVLLILLECCGLVLVGLEVSGTIKIEVVSIIACLSASVVAWIETRQFRTLAEAYFVASEELAAIEARIDSQDSSSWPDFVDQSEEAVSREHTLWRASRGHDRA